MVLFMSVIGTVPSGGDRLVLELIRRWPSDSGAVIVITTEEGLRQLQSLRIDNVSIELVRGPGVTCGSVALAYLVRAFFAPLIVARVVSRSRSRLALSSSPFLPDTVAALAARALGASWILSWQLVIPPVRLGYDMATRSSRLGELLSHRHFWGTVRLWLSYVSQNLTLQLARRWSKTVIVPTNLMASEAAARGLRVDQIHIANYCVDMAEVQRGISRRSSEDSETYDGIFVGRFHPQKGLDDLVAAWRRVQLTIPMARLCVIGGGTGQVATQFVASTRTFPPGTVTFLGVLTGPEKYAAMSKAKLLLFPSHHESWGLVALEGMAVGIPVVGYDLPSSREAFGTSMVSAPCFDVNALANAIVQLLTNEDLRRECIKHGQETAQRYSWDNVAGQFARTVLE